MFKLPKTTIQICLDRDDLEYLEDLGRRYGRQNASQAVTMLIKHTLQLEKKIENLTAAAQQQKPSYEEIRTQQIGENKREMPPETPKAENSGAIDKPEWDFLKKTRDKFDKYGRRI